MHDMMQNERGYTTTTLGNSSDSPVLGNMEQKRYNRCPYIRALTDMMCQCAATGGTTQSGYDFQQYCMSATNYVNCPNYKSAR